MEGRAEGPFQVQISYYSVSVNPVLSLSWLSVVIVRAAHQCPACLDPNEEQSESTPVARHISSKVAGKVRCAANGTGFCPLISCLYIITGILCLPKVPIWHPHTLDTTKTSENWTEPPCCPLCSYLLCQEVK